MKILKYIALYAVLAVAWIVLVMILALYGWWMSPVVPAEDAESFNAWAQEQLQTQNKGTAAMLILSQGQLVNEYYQGDDINADTLFPTASFSKFIAALAVMTLVDAGEVELDAPVTRYISDWQLPPSEFDHEQVTVRRLLSHTAGLTDGLGFGDYGADESVPSTVESLRAPRASSGDRQIRVGVEPGSEYIYSGGGYLILQLLVEQVVGDSFANYAQAAVLARRGMHRSNYGYLGEMANATESYALDGSIAPSYRYASAAATGLNSTARDLSRLAKSLIDGDRQKTMREPQAYLFGSAIWGLGTILYAPTQAGDWVYGHDGGNDPAINSTFRINPDNGDALIVLVSGHPNLASSIGGEWVLWQTGYPDFLSTARVINSATLPVALGLILLFAFVVVLARRKG